MENQSRFECHGYTITEAVVALTIFATLSTFLFVSLSNADYLFSNSSSKLTMMVIAENFIERHGFDTSISLNDTVISYTISDVNQYSLSVTVTPLEKYLEEITLQISKTGFTKKELTYRYLRKCVN